MKCVAKLAKLATAVTAVKAGNNELTLSVESNIFELVRAVKAVDSL